MVEAIIVGDVSSILIQILVIAAAYFVVVLSMLGLAPAFELSKRLGALFKQRLGQQDRPLGFRCTPSEQADSAPASSGRCNGR